jgi:hypothetical protein
MVVSLLGQLDDLAAGEPGLRVLVDQSDLNPGTVDLDGLRAIGDAWRSLRHIGGSRIAVVAPSEVVFGMNRQAIAFADASAAKSVFRTRAEAEAWLSL